MSVTVFFLGITSYYSLFLVIILMGIGVGVVVSMFLLRLEFLVEQILDCCAFMWPFTVTS